jgi:membrane-associated protease RseP (regulator of RpoE activity)
MTAACPNCRSQVYDEQLFCRVCGMCLDNGFQVSTHKLGLPPVERMPLTQRPTVANCDGTVNWHSHVFPIVGFIFALFIGGFTAALLTDTPNLGSQINTVAVSERSYMGVYLVNDYDSNSVVIDRIVENSPAEKAGLHSGDRILAINNQTVHEASDVVSQMLKIAPDSQLVIRAENNRTIYYASLHTVRRDALNLQMTCQHEGFLGVGDLQSDIVYMNDDEKAISGVKVGFVVEDSAAELAGLEAGDTIITINSIAVESPEELGRNVRSVTPEKNVSLLIARNNELMVLETTMGNRP